MSETPSVGHSGPWPLLDIQERRVLGVLIEKQKTSKSADTYPLSLNSLTVGCNQKSNRFPLLNLEEEEVEQAVLRCMKRNLVARVTGSRVVRWRHLLYETWHVDRVDLAILAELLLRGPQTEGELRTRVSRMDPVEDLDSLRAALKPLSERKLVIYLTPEERRGTVVTHGFHDAKEIEMLRKHFQSEIGNYEVNQILQGGESQPVSAGATSQVATSFVSDEGKQQLSQLESEILDLRQKVNQLEEVVRTLQQDFSSLKSSLGG